MTLRLSCCAHRLSHIVLGLGCKCEAGFLPHQVPKEWDQDGHKAGQCHVTAAHNYAHEHWPLCQTVSPVLNPLLCGLKNGLRKDLRAEANHHRRKDCSASLMGRDHQPFMHASNGIDTVSRCSHTPHDGITALQTREEGRGQGVCTWNDAARWITTMKFATLISQGGFLTDRRTSGLTTFPKAA